MRAALRHWWAWSFCAATCGALAGAPAVARAEWETRDLGGTSTHVYTPASSSPIGRGRALLVVLHGCSQLASTLRDHGNFEAAAEGFGFVIALPSVPGGGVLAGCWNYYGGQADAETTAVIAVAEELLADPTLEIDAAQRYVAGFSSGGGEAQVVACSAPDVFAGVAVVAGPALGTEVADVFLVPPGLDAATLAQRCSALAGPAAADLATHLGITLSDSADFTVAQAYATLDAQMLATLYEEQGAVLSTSTDDLGDEAGAMPSGTAHLWSDVEGPRLARLETSGLGHNWPAGSGRSPGLITFVTGDGIDFASYAARFFTDNNRRVRDEGETEGTGGSEGTDGGGTETGPVDATTGGGLDDTGGTGGTDDTGAGASGSANDGDGGSTSDAGATADPDATPSGCQCGAPGSRPRGLGWAWVGLLLVALGRRRA